MKSKGMEESKMYIRRVEKRIEKKEMKKNILLYRYIILISRIKK